MFDILGFAKEQGLNRMVNMMQGSFGRRDYSTQDTPVGSGYYSKRQHKSGGKWNYKLIKSVRSPLKEARYAIEPLVGPQTERRRKLLLKRKEAGLTSNGRKVA